MTELSQRNDVSNVTMRSKEDIMDEKDNDHAISTGWLL